jgi:hypothetical protein
VNVFNHASTAFGDVVWAGQSTRHIQQALAEAGLSQERIRALWAATSPCSYYDKIVSPEAAGPLKKVLVVHANYDLTFPLQYSLEVLQSFKRICLNFESRTLPCGHYTTGETPYQYIDGWYMGSFVYRAFKALRKEKAASLSATAVELAESEVEEDAVAR